MNSFIADRDITYMDFDFTLKLVTTWIETYRLDVLPIKGVPNLLQTYLRFKMREVDRMYHQFEWQKR